MYANSPNITNSSPGLVVSAKSVADAQKAAAAQKAVELARQNIRDEQVVRSQRSLLRKVIITVNVS